MAKTLVVTLTDDLDGSPADETVAFALDGKGYEIDLSKWIGHPPAQAAQFIAPRKIAGFS